MFNFILLTRISYTTIGYEELTKEVTVQDETTRQVTFKLQREVSKLSYLDYESTVKKMNDLSMTYAHHTKLYSIGTSVEGRNLWVMEVGDQTISKEGQPQVRIVAGIHGNEMVGKVIALELIEDLCSRVERDDAIKEVRLTPKIMHSFVLNLSNIIPYPLF